MKTWRQQELLFRTRGGRRRGAGRKPAPFRRDVPHRKRPEHRKHQPAHVTLRASRLLPNFRNELLFAAILRTLGKTARAWFRLVHYSVQADHLHLLVEADDKSSLTRGLSGAIVRLARAVNRVQNRPLGVGDATT
jgi:REP-associated tyrosine transposase